MIVFSSGHLGLFQISAGGGTAVKVPIAEKDQAGYRWPSFLPDGKHVLVTSNDGSGGIFAVTLATGQVQLVLPGENGPAQYIEPGYLLFLRGGDLLAQPFDARAMRTSGSAQSIAESVAAATRFSVSDNGMLLYQRSFSGPTHVGGSGRQEAFDGRRSGLPVVALSLAGWPLRYGHRDPARTKKSEALVVRPEPGHCAAHSLLATETIFIRHGLPTAGKWLSLPHAAAARKTSTLSQWAEAVASNCC